MLVHFFLRAHCSAAFRSPAPAPLPLCCLLTTKPLISARSGTSSNRETLTCSQPMTSPSGASATKTALSPAGFRRPSRLFISVAVAGYPSSVQSTARRAESLLRARRISSTESLAMFRTDHARLRRSRGLRRWQLEGFVGVEKDCDRAFIHQLHGHGCLKDAGGNVDS